MSIESIRNFIAEDMLAVDMVIRSRLDSEVALIRQISEYIIGNGGKRLRPLLVLLSSGAFDFKGKERLELAATIEFIHTATLLHDDVVDTSEQRRGKATANALFGNAASVLVGDFLYSRAFQMMVEVDIMEVMRTVANATNVIAEGEVLQLLNCHNADIDEDSYLQVIRYKTAKLFEAASRVGAILGGASSEQMDAMSAYGMHLGTAFQLIDDVLDYSGEIGDTGKNLGDDLLEGKPTLPLIHALEHGTPEQAKLIRSAIENGGIEEFEAILAAMKENDSLEYAKDRARSEAHLACQAIASIPDSRFKESMVQLADFAVTR
ncbi:MAG: octaprenyl diphosphate synthase, partial [Burkholderiales bacterium]|nr:octaprenyl diphosphate synthase [Burkholderiales bacterium]